MGALAPWHWAVLIIVVLLLFGGRLLPRLGRSLGKSLTGLKEGVKEGTEEFKSAVNSDADKANSDAADKPKEGDGS
jgi:sec-independent protein translocase protein TatA